MHLDKILVLPPLALLSNRASHTPLCVPLLACFRESSGAAGICQARRRSRSVRQGIRKMLARYFAQNRTGLASSVAASKPWLVFNLSSMVLAGVEEFPFRGNPSRFSALVSAVLELLLSILLLLGAVIACVTSQFARFFGLEPPCSYIGCSRPHAQRKTVPDGDCHIYSQYVSTNHFTRDTTFSRKYAEPGACHSLKQSEPGPVEDVSYSEEVETGNYDQIHGSSNRGWSDLDCAYFMCSNCNDQLSRRLHRRRFVKRKIASALQDASNQVHWDITDGAIGNNVTETCEEGIERIYTWSVGEQTGILEGNSDTERSQSCSDTSTQGNDVSSTSSGCSVDPDMKDNSGSVDPLLIVERDAQGKFDERIDDELQDAAEDEAPSPSAMCRRTNSDCTSKSLPLLAHELLSTGLHEEHTEESSKDTVDGIEQELCNRSKTMELLVPGSLAEVGQSENIKANEEKITTEDSLDEEQESSGSMTRDVVQQNSEEVAKQGEIVEKIRGQANSEEHLGGKANAEEYLSEMSQQVDSLKETKRDACVQELLEESLFLQENAGKRSCYSVEPEGYEQTETTEQDARTSPHEALPNNKQLQEPEGQFLREQSVKEVEGEFLQQESQHERRQEETQRVMLPENFIQKQIDDKTGTDLHAILLHQEFQCEESTEVGIHNAALECLPGLLAIAESHIQEVQLEDSVVPAQGASLEAEQEQISGGSTGEPSGESPEETQVETESLKHEGSNEEGTITSIEDNKRRGELEEVQIEPEHWLENKSQLLGANYSEELEASFQKLEEDVDIVVLENQRREAQQIGKGELTSDLVEQNLQEDSSQDFTVEISIQGLEQHEEMIEIRGMMLLEDYSGGVQQDEENLHLTEMSEDGADDLREAFQAGQNALSDLYVELEEERKAAAIAASEAMAMISRLQEEKAAMQMEAAQYQRMVEEKAMYDQQALTLLKEILFKREKEKHALEKEVELYREQLLKTKAHEMKITDMDKRNDVLLLKGTDKKVGFSSERQPSGQCAGMDPYVEDREGKFTRMDRMPGERLKGLLLGEDEVRQGVDLRGQEDEESEVYRSSLAGVSNGIVERRQNNAGEMNGIEHTFESSFRSNHLDHIRENLERSVFSTEDEETQFILERLCYLEEELRELGGQRKSGPWNPDTNFLELNSLDQNTKKAATPGTRTPYGSSGSKLQSATPCKSSTTGECNGSGDFDDGLNAHMKEAGSSLRQLEESHIRGDGFSLVHDIYEVQQGSRQCNGCSFDWEGKENLRCTDDRLGKPDLSPGNISQESLPSTGFVRNQYSRRNIKGRNLSHSPDMTAFGTMEKANWDSLNSDGMPYPTGEWPLNAPHQDVCSKSMIIRDNRRMMAEVEVQELTTRLQVLEADREVLRQTLESLKQKDTGMDLLQEIVQHLRELKTGRKALDTKEPQTCLTLSLEVQTPALKKRRFTSESNYTHSLFPSEQVMESQIITPKVHTHSGQDQC